MEGGRSYNNNFTGLHHESSKKYCSGVKNSIHGKYLSFFVPLEECTQEYFVSNIVFLDLVSSI